MATRFNVLDGPGGNVIDTVLADLAFMEATFTDFEEVPNTTPSNVQYLRTRLSLREFRDKFTEEEKDAFYDLEARAGTIDIADPTRPLALRMRAFLDDLRSMDFVDINFEQTITSVTLLETFGLIAPGRADEILQGIPE